MTRRAVIASHCRTTTENHTMITEEQIEEVATAVILGMSAKAELFMLQWGIAELIEHDLDDGYKILLRIHQITHDDQALAEWRAAFNRLYKHAIPQIKN